MKTLKPIRNKPDLHIPVERSIMRMFDDVIYKAIMKIITEATGQKINARSVLEQAIISGRVQYVNGRFYGSFNSKISKELKAMGAKYSASLKSYGIQKTLLTPSVTIAVATSRRVFEDMHKNILDKLDVDNITRQIEEMDYSGEFSTALNDVESQFQSTTSSIGVDARLTEEAKILIAEQYNNNLNLYIKDFTQKNIVELREKVWQNTFNGYRTDRLIKIIQDDRKVSHNKAKFLAKQETNLFLSKYKQSRYADVGVTKYRWRTSGLPSVRSDHKRLNGQIFSFDAPPVTNLSTGTHNNPSEDFGCNCIAEPIID